MVERARLTKSIVDRAEPPIRGESWIADTQQRGFGLRLWRSPNGEAGKNYCVRVSDPRGKGVRRSLTYWEGYHLYRNQHIWDFDYRVPPTVGDLIEIAREWARDAIDEIKERPTLRQQDAAQKAAGKQRAAALTLTNAVRAVISTLRQDGLSQAYCDQLDKLYSVNVPKNIGDKAACEVALDEVIEVLDATKPGNLRQLRPLLGRALDIPRRFGVRSAASSLRLRYIGRTVSNESDLPPQLKNWSQDKFTSFVETFERYEEKWQQAFCLRFYLQFHAPLSQVMAARWDNLYESIYQPFLGADQPPRKQLVWKYVERWGRHEILRGSLLELLRTCRDRGESEVLGSSYWFPSRLGRTVGHIRSIDHVWRGALHQHGLRYISPRLFRTAFHGVVPLFGFEWA